MIYNDVPASAIAGMSQGPQGAVDWTTPGVIVELVDANSDVNLEQITLGVAFTDSQLAIADHPNETQPRG